MTAQEFMEGAKVTALGGDWGEPLWRFENEQAALSVDVHAADEDAARAKVAEVLPDLLEGRP